MSAPVRWLLFACASLAVAGAIGLRRHQGPREQLLDVGSRRNPGEPPMVPWRDPSRDMAALFPGADSYRTDTLIFSRHAHEIVRRIGPGARLDSTRVFAHRILSHGNVIGTVLVRRSPGEHGAIEVVLGVNPVESVTGVRIQRLREPQAAESFLTSARWLDSFVRKTAESTFTPGLDLPAAPESARKTADVVAESVRYLLVILSIAEPGASHPAH